MISKKYSIFLALLLLGIGLYSCRNVPNGGRGGGLTIKMSISLDKLESLDFSAPLNSASFASDSFTRHISEYSHESQSVTNRLIDLVTKETEEKEGAREHYAQKLGDLKTFPVIGIQQCGNTCFLNSVMQILLHTKGLSLYLKEGVFDKATQPFSYHTKEFFENYYKAAESGKRFLSNPAADDFSLNVRDQIFTSVRDQQDAAEFFNKLVDRIRSEAFRLPAFDSLFTSVKNARGLDLELDTTDRLSSWKALRDALRSSAGDDNEFPQMITYVLSKLELGEKSELASHEDFQFSHAWFKALVNDLKYQGSRLDFFSRYELSFLKQLKQGAQSEIPEGKTSLTVEKVSQAIDLPIEYYENQNNPQSRREITSLKGAFKRYERKEILEDEIVKYGRQEKQILTLLPGEYETALPSGGELLHYLPIALKRFNVLGGKIGHAVTYPETLVFYRPLKNDKKRALTYKLYGVSLHSGGTGGGHYTAYVKNFDGKWHYCNDSSSGEIDLRKVLSAKNEAYLLFYELVEDKVLKKK